VGSPGGRGRRKSRTLSSFYRPAVDRLQALARRFGRTLLARGPLILVGTGTLFLVLMVAFLYFVPLPAPVVPVATRVLDRNGELVGSLFSQNRIPVPLSEMPEVLKQGFRIEEVPVRFVARTFEEGKKIGWRDGVRAIWCILKYNLLR